VYRVIVGKTEAKNNLEDTDVDGRIILGGSSGNGT
jgi:hypothetical protein